MNFSELQRRLFAAARSGLPGDAVPFAFEKRIMARLAVQPVFDKWAFWSHALWRAAAPCVAITLALIAWSLLSSASNSPSADFSQQLESTVFAVANPDASGGSM